MVSLLLAGVALADPVALRVPGERATVVVGLPAAGAAWWVDEHLGVSLDLMGLDAVGASVGWRDRVLGAPEGLGVDVVFGGGVLLHTTTGAPLLSLAPAASAGWSRPHLDAHLGLALPFALGMLPDGQLRAPVLGTLTLGSASGPLRFGLDLELGTLRLTGAPPEVGFQGGVYLGWDGGSGRR